MIHDRSLLAGSLIRVYRLVVQPARALGCGFVLLAWMIVAPFVRVLTWLRRIRIGADPRRRAAQVTPAERVMTYAPSPQGAPVRHALSFSAHLAVPEVECVEVGPESNERLYPTVCALLQLVRRSKLLDLRSASAINLDLFERLASAWTAPPGTVLRLGILLGFEAWTVLRDAAARRLKPILDEGVAVELFYDQQFPSLPSWFSHGLVHHDHLPAVLELLRTRWRVTAIWPAVLGTTAMLVHAHAPGEDVPDFLIEIAAIALSFGGLEAAEQAAGYARAVLTWVGDTPSAARCRALRSLATATMVKGDIDAGLAHLETAVTTAMVMKDPVEEASALHQIGVHALQGQHFARAEDRFRRAIEVLTAVEFPSLLATLHHDLEVALAAQGKNDEEPDHRASAALELR
jgi:hypothetical protein